MRTLSLSLALFTLLCRGGIAAALLFRITVRAVSVRGSRAFGRALPSGHGSCFLDPPSLPPLMSASFPQRPDHPPFGLRGGSQFGTGRPCHSLRTGRGRREGGLPPPSLPLSNDLFEGERGRAHLSSLPPSAASLFLGARARAPAHCSYVRNGKWPEEGGRPSSLGRRSCCWLRSRRGEGVSERGSGSDCVACPMADWLAAVREREGESAAAILPA